MEKKRWLICSHERSGTEWLIASIIKNLFPYLYQPDSDQQIRWDMDGERFCDPEVVEEFLFSDVLRRNAMVYNNPDTRGIVSGRNPDVPVKSHHAFDFFESLWDRIIQEYHVLYIMRDGRDVMTSMWRHGWNDEGFVPRAFNVKQFIETRPTEEMGRYHGDYRVGNMADRWENHLNSWALKDGVLYLSYEQLSLRYKETIRAIAIHGGLPIPSEVDSPGMTGVRPWKGQIGNWRNFISEEDLAFFNKNTVAGRRMVRNHNMKLKLNEKGWTECWSRRHDIT